MSEITPEMVAAAVCEGGTGWMDSLQAALSLTARDNILGMEVARWDGPENGETVRCFRAVVVEGDEIPIVLEWPAELGMSWHDGGDMLALTRDGITIFPGGADEWVIPPQQAREMAAQLAAMAAVYEVAQAEQDSDLLPETCGDCETGKCHGTEPDECGCARHEASAEAAQTEQSGGAS